MRAFLILVCAFFSFSVQARETDTLQVRRQIASTLKEKKPLQEVFKTNQEGLVKSLLEIVHDENERDDIRWASLIGLARVTGKESVSILRKFLNHPNWMLRDASLKAAAALNAKELATDIEMKVFDNALVIRTTAVKTIGLLELKKSAPALVKALFDDRNFNGGKAMWIHKHILSVIKDFQYTPALPKLVDLLEKNPSDIKLQEDVIHTLEALTNKKFPGTPVSQQIYLWKRNAISEATF